VTYWLRR